MGCEIAPCQGLEGSKLCFLTFGSGFCYERGMNSERIDGLRKKFHNEWLLIVVDEMDETNTIPLKGHLLGHSPNRDEIYQEEMKCRGNTLTIYSEEGLPQGYAAAFFYHV